MLFCLCGFHATVAYSSLGLIDMLYTVSLTAKLSQTKLTPPIIFSIYYRQANAIDASVRKQITLEIVFTQVP